MAINNEEIQTLLKQEIKNEIPAEEGLAAAESTEATDEHETLENQQPELNSLKKIIIAKSNLMKVKEELGSIVDSIAANPSLITKASNQWGSYSIWYKVGAGLALSIPTLVAGIIANVGALMIIGGATGLAYAGSAFVLEDHHSHTVDNTGRLKEGVFSLAGLLDGMIKKLDKICNELKIEVAKFVQENLKLAKHITVLGGNVDSLAFEVEKLVKIEKLLGENRASFEKTAKQLDGTVREQSDLLVQNQKELTKVKDDYMLNQKELSEKIAELQTLRDSMDIEIDKARTITDTLRGAVVSLSGTVVKDNEQRIEFQKSLDTFLNDKDANFHIVAKRVSVAEEELDRVKKELEVSIKRYQQLLDRQEKQVILMEHINMNREKNLQTDESNENIASKVNSGLQKNSIYNNKNPLKDGSATSSRVVKLRV